MRALTLTIGGGLTATGVVAYVMTQAASWTALIPAFAGVLLLVLGFIAGKPSARMHALHGALVVALLGILGSAMNAFRIGEVFAGTAERPAAIVTSAIMFVALLVLLVAGIRSFVVVRRERAKAKAGA